MTDLNVPISHELDIHSAKTQSQAQDHGSVHSPETQQPHVFKLPKVRLIKNRPRPIARGVFEQLVFEDSQEYVNQKLEEERLRKLKLARQRKEEEERRLLELKRQQEEERLRKEAEELELAKIKAAEEEAARRKAQEEEEARLRALEEEKRLREEEERKLQSEQNTIKKGPLVPRAWSMPVWNKDPNFKVENSIFERFNTLEGDDLRAMFDTDISNSSLDKYFNSKEDFNAMKDLLWDYHYYYRILMMFQNLSSSSNFPEVGSNDCLNFLKNTKAFDDQNLTQPMYNITKKDVNEDSAKDGNKKDRDLSRFEFLDLVIRLAIKKYKKTGIYDTFQDAIIQFLDNDILPFMDQFSSIREYSGIRWEEIYTVEVDRVLQKNKKDIDNLFKKISGRQAYCELNDVTKMVRSAKLNNVSNREAIWCFSHSQQVCIDEKKGGQTRMSKTEFYEFLVRISQKQFEGSNKDLDKILSQTLKKLI